MIRIPITFRIIPTAILSLFLSLSSDAADWPQWLGPQRRPVWNESGIIKTFPDEGPTLRWTAELGGGYSGPSIADGKVFVMDRKSGANSLDDGQLLHEGEPPKNQNFVRRLLPGKERVVCLRESDGTPLWTHSYDRDYSTVSLYAIGPRCTPTVDRIGNDPVVFTLGAEGDLFCLKASDGEVIWNRDLQKDYDLEIQEWGIAAHPLVDDDRLICVVGGKDSTVVAFDKRTGKELWRALNAHKPGYCAPVIYNIYGERTLVVWDSDAVSGLAPKTGNVLWSVEFAPTFAMSIGAPQLYEGSDGTSLFLMAFNRRSCRVQIAKDNRSAEIAWQGNTKIGIGGVLNTPVIVGDHIYACGIGGRYICANVKDGRRLWSTFAPSTGKRPAHWANVFTIQHEDRFIHANDLGDLIFAKMTPDGYEEISRAHLIEPTHEIGGRTVVWSHPAFANRSIYLRNDKEIRCYSLAAEDLAK